MNYSELSNSELNERIAELLGISLPETWMENGEPNVGARHYCESYDLAFNVVVEKMRERAWSFTCARPVGTPSYAAFYKETGETSGHIRSDSLCRAICIAALVAEKK